MIADTIREVDDAWWDVRLGPSESTLSESTRSKSTPYSLPPTQSPSRNSIRPLSFPFQRANSTASSSTSTHTSPLISPDSLVDSNSSSSAHKRHDFIYSQFFPMPSSLNPPITSIERNPQLNPHLPTLHSRQASIRSTLSRASSTSSTDEDDEDSESISRASSPISLATTFGGGGRGGHRSRTTSADRDISPDVPFNESSSRYTRSNSFDSARTGQSTLASFSQSIASHRTFFGRRFAPNIAARQSSMAFARESENLPRPAEMDHVGSWSRDVDREIRSAPGVIGLGEGWAGGPAKQRNKRQGGWLRRKGRRKGKMDGDDPLALWTVPEEPRTSPIKAAWNRSRARFGASVPALGLHSPRENEGRSIGQRARSVFSSSRADLRATQRVNGSMIELGGRGKTTTTSLLQSSIQGQGFPSRSWQPYGPPPRSASLPPKQTSHPVSSVYSTPANLSRVSTFGGGGGSGRAGEEISPESGEKAESNPPSTSKSPIHRQNILHKIKSRLSAMSDALRLRNSAKAPDPSSHRSDFPHQSDSPRPSARLAIPLRVGSRPRPVSIVPLAPEAIDSPPRPEEQPPRITRSQSVRSILGKFGRRSSSSKLQEEHVEDRFSSPEKLKRRSYAGTFGHLPQTKSESDLLGYKRSSWRETLDDLISRLKEVQVPGEDGGLGPKWEMGTGEASARPSSQLERTHDNELSLPQLGTSVSATTGSSIATPSTPSPPSGSPIKPEKSVSPGLSPRPPSFNFAWAAQPGKLTRRKSDGNGLLDVDAAQRWLSGPGGRGIYDERA